MLDSDKDAIIETLVAALRPFAGCSASRMSSVIDPKDQWLWAPSNLNQVGRGINLAHIYAARRALNMPEENLDIAPCVC